MTIRPFLADQPFGPELINEMSVALTNVCTALGLAERDDQATRLVAEKVIHLAQRGVRDASQLTAMTLDAFKRE